MRILVVPVQARYSSGVGVLSVSPPTRIALVEHAANIGQTVPAPRRPGCGSARSNREQGRTPRMLITDLFGRTHRSRALGALLATVAAASPALAQKAPPSPGSRVRPLLVHVNQ